MQAAGYECDSCLDALSQAFCAVGVNAEDGCVYTRTLLCISIMLLPLTAHATKHCAHPRHDGCLRSLWHITSISCPELVRMPPQRQMSEGLLICRLADLPQQCTTMHMPTAGILILLQGQSCCSFKDILLIWRPGNTVCTELAAMTSLNLLPSACKHPT